MIYIEPAPYIVHLIRVLRQRHPDISLRVLYIHAALTQPWEAGLDDGVSELLPASPKEAAKVLSQAIRAGDFDILHLAGWGHPLLMRVLILGIFFGRIISVESDTQLPDREPSWKALVKRLLYPMLFSRIAVFFPGGSRQKRYFRHYCVSDKKIRVAQMTVDVTQINQLVADTKGKCATIRERMGLKSVSVVFIFVGRLEEYKGITLLLDAFEKIESTTVQLLIVGDGNLRNKIEHKASNIRRIHYMGRSDFAEVMEALAISDVVVVPSSFEPWGLVVNEAMAAGLPVIASNRVGCVDDLVQHGITGLIFPTGDTTALEMAMQRLAGDKLLRKQMGEAGRILISQWRLEDEAEIMTNAWQEQMKL